MALVLMATHPWGTLWDPAGNVQPGEQASFTNIDDATAVTHYADADASSPSTGPVTADANGRLMRWVAEDTYLQELPGGTILQVEATSGRTLRSVESSIANLSINLKDLGAVEGGSLDAALALADTATPANGAEWVIPRGSYTFTAFPVLDGLRGIVIRGESGLSGGAGAGSRITYAGADGTSPISARSSVGVEIHNLEINHSATGTEPLIDLSATGTKGSASGRGSDTQLFVMRGCRVQGTALANLLDLDRAILCSFHDTMFYKGLVGIRGKAASATYSNAIQFFGCTFLGAVTCHVKDTGQNWGFFGCTFEQLFTSGGANAGAGAITSTLACAGLIVSGCYFGDANDTGTWVTIGASSAGVVIEGCTITHAATGIATGSSVFGTKISGNHFANLTTAISLGANPLGSMIDGNNFTNGGIVALGTVQGLTVMGNKFNTGVAALVIDGTGAKGVMFIGNDIVSATSGLTFSAGAMPVGSIIQDQSNYLTIASLKSVSGAVSDASFPATPRDGTIALDITNFRLYCRFAGVWKSVVLA